MTIVRDILGKASGILMGRQQFRRIAALFIAFFILIISQRATVKVDASEYWPDGPDIETPSAILMEESTGTILYEKDAYSAQYPASITKIMTTLIALENSSLDEVVTFSDDAINNTEGSGIARDYGEMMTMEQCLYAVMLTSANECAYAVAEHVGGGDVNAFVDMMNEKAQELGCVNTHFSNPHGLQDENHYTCAYDMALIARAAYENETFRIITGTARYTIPPTNKHSESTPLANHNEMLYPWQQFKYRYEYCTGGKTGYTDIARSTLVTYAEKDGMTLVCVVMHTESPNQWIDSTTLFDYGFDNFQILNIASNETRYSDNSTDKAGTLQTNEPFVDIDQSAVIVMPKMAEFLDATGGIEYDTTRDDVVGSIVYTYAGREVGRADIEKTGATVENILFGSVSDNEDAEEDDGSIRIKKTTIAAIILIAAAIIVLIIGIKKLMDNFYIIRHNLEVRRNQRAQFKVVKKKRRRPWRRR
jgi:D-alanyl-D-alanine carboxypeptidase